MTDPSAGHDDVLDAMLAEASAADAWLGAALAEATADDDAWLAETMAET